MSLLSLNGQVIADADAAPIDVTIDSIEQLEAIASSSTDGAAAFAKIQVIALTIPKLGDGRALSWAAWLRQRWGFTGELRAVGVVTIDVLHMLARTGFSSFALSDGESVRTAQAMLQPFAKPYQGVEPTPQQAKAIARFTRGENDVG